MFSSFRKRNAEKQDAKSLRRRGDAERDSGNWSAAVAAYQSYLEANPSEFAIFVQLGNCAKEAGDLNTARRAYLDAKKLNDSDADLFLQLGHLYKISGENGAAMESYRRALKLDAKSPAAGELAFFEGVRKPATATAFLDVTDVICFLRENSRLSGIQRVIANIFGALRSDPSLFPGAYRCCMLDAETRTLREVPNGAFAQALKAVGAHTKREELNAALDKCLGHQEIKAQTKDVYIILGAFWISPAYIPALMDLRSRGVITSLFVHDLIPITHRLEVDPNTANDFTTRFLQIVALCDHAWTSSNYVANELRVLVKRELNREIPVTATRLGQDKLQPSAKQLFSDSVLALARDDFALCVGTIEARKNHRYLFDIWSDLIAERGDAAPTLVLVGRWGWRVDSLRQAIEESNHLDGKLVVLSSISDDELSYLYEKSLFTLFPSLVEGWGLPVGESLAHGKTCIVSHSSSLPEVGGDFVIYIDPLNISDGKAKIRWALDNREEIAARNKRIAETFEPTTWTNVTERLGKVIDHLSQTLTAENDCYCDLPLAQIVPLRRREIETLSLHRMQANLYPLTCFSGWDIMERDIPWAQRTACTLRFRVEGRSEAHLVRVALRLELPTPDSWALIRVRAGGEDAEALLLDGAPRWQFCDMRSDDRGVFEATLSIVKSSWNRNEPVEQRYFGLSALILCAKDSIEQRLGMIETVAASFPGSVQAGREDRVQVETLDVA